MSSYLRKRHEAEDEDAFDAAAAGLAALAGRRQVRARVDEEPAKKLVTPGSVISYVRKHFEPLFGKEHNRGATERGFMKLLDVVESRDCDEKARLEKELAEVREERDLLKLRSVESTILRNASFEAEFGIDKETFPV
jgi:hypothetical protein